MTSLSDLKARVNEARDTERVLFKAEALCLITVAEAARLLAAAMSDKEAASIGVLQSAHRVRAANAALDEQERTA